MKCEYVAANLYEYIYGELDDRSCNDIRVHLEQCGKCRSEHEELKQLLIEDARPLLELKEKIEAPKELGSKVRHSIEVGLRRKRIKQILAACLVCAFIYTAPVFVYYAAQVFPIEKYVDFLGEDMIRDFEEGRGQAIGKSSTMKNITFTVDGMIKQGSNDHILFTIKVPKTEEYNYGMPLSGNNVITVEDQFGKKYSVGSAAGTSKRAFEEGEFQYIFEISEPLSFWSYKLNIRLTAIELGYSNEKESRFFEKYKNVYGNWNVSFYINRRWDWR